MAAGEVKGAGSEGDGQAREGKGEVQGRGYLKENGRGGEMLRCKRVARLSDEGREG